MYVWGYGILGKGPNVDSAEFPTRIPPTLFGRNEFNTETKVKDVQAGLTHLMAVNSTYTHTYTHSHTHSNLINSASAQRFITVSVNVYVCVAKRRVQYISVAASKAESSVENKS